MYREQTKVVKIGNRVIGGGNPILIQSMTNTKTEDVEATVAQILELEAAGCDIIRSTVPTLEAAKALGEIKKRIHIPIVADIHFDYRMAIAAIENGADKIRINPGNIGSSERVKAVTFPYFSMICFSNEPLFTPTRIGTLYSFALSTTAFTLSEEPIFPGLILILSAPFSIAAIAIR